MLLADITQLVRVLVVVLKVTGSNPVIRLHNNYKSF